MAPLNQAKRLPGTAPRWTEKGGLEQGSNATRVVSNVHGRSRGPRQNLGRLAEAKFIHGIEALESAFFLERLKFVFLYALRRHVVGSVLFAVRARSLSAGCSWP